MAEESLEFKVYMSPENDDLIAKLAVKLNVPRESMVERAINEYFEAQNIEEPLTVADPLLGKSLRAARMCAYASADLVRLVMCLDRKTTGDPEWRMPLWAPPATILFLLLAAVRTGLEGIPPAVKRLRKLPERIKVPVPPNPDDASPGGSIAELTAHETALEVAEHMLSLVWLMADSDAYSECMVKYPDRIKRWPYMNLARCEQELPNVSWYLQKRLPLLDVNELVTSCEREATWADQGNNSVEVLKGTNQAPKVGTSDWEFQSGKASYRGGKPFKLRGRLSSLLRLFIKADACELTDKEIKDFNDTALDIGGIYKVVSELRQALRNGLHLEGRDPVKSLGERRWALSLDD